MRKGREIEGHFSWIPPPLTVIKLKEKYNRFEKWERSPATNRPNDAKFRREENVVDEAKQVENARERLGERNEERFKSNGDAYQDEMDADCRESQCHQELIKHGNGTEKCIIEEEVRSEWVPMPESGFEFSFPEDFNDDDHDGVNGAHGEEEEEEEGKMGANRDMKLSFRKKSGSEHYRIGRKAVNVDDLMKSRKISEIHPSQKFLSFSFQNNDEMVNEGTSDAGVMYLKRLDEEKANGLSECGEEKEWNKSEKKKQKDKRNKEMRKMAKREHKKKKLQQINSNGSVKMNGGRNESIIVVEEAGNFEDIQKEGMIANRKKHVFTQEDINSEPIDVDDVLNRKKSTTSYKEKFLSISFERSENMVKEEVTPRGGLYGKTIGHRR